MKYIILVSIIVLSALFGCTDDGNPLSSGAYRGVFVIDMLNVTGTVKIDTLTNRPATFITLRLSFHFDGQPGSLDGFSLSTRNIVLAGIFEPYAPTPIGERCSISPPDLHDTTTFIGEDSILVSVGFGGRFWERINNTPVIYGTFSTPYSLWVRLQR